jgi:putative ABC transport system substrate-binding protein
MKLRKFIWLITWFSLIVPATLAAEKEPKILLINSDATVEKYKVAQEEFVKAFPHPVLKVNLSDKKWRIPDVEDLLYDEYPDLTYCIGTKAYLIANRFISEKDIIFSSIINWHRLPMTKKTYGVSNELHSGMQITLFRYIFPEVKKLGVLYSEKYNSQWFNETKLEAKEMGLKIIGGAVSENRQARSALKELLPDIDALWFISDPLIVSDKKILMEVFKECDAKKVPVFTYHDIFVEYGAVLIVSVDDPTIGRQAAGIAAEVLSVGKMDEKVQYPAGSHIILNLKKVKEYGLHYKEETLNAVNQIVE